MSRETSTPKVSPTASEESLLEDTDTTLTGSPIVAESGYVSASHLSHPFSPSSASFFSESASFQKPSSPPDTVTFHPKYTMTTIEDLEKANKQLTTQVSDLSNAIHKVLADNAKLTDSVTSLQDQNKTATDALDKSVKALQSQSSTFGDQYKDLHQSLSNADANISLLQTELQEARDKLNKYESEEKTTDLHELCTLLKQLVTKPAPAGASSSKPRGPNLTLPRFDGSMYSSFEKWRMELETCFKYFEWTHTDPQCANIIPTLLDDYAHAQYLTLSTDETATYTNCITALEKLFSMQKKPISMRRNYLNRKQKINESVREYSSIMLHRFAECNPPLESQVDIFLNNLLPQIAAEIQDEEYTSINALVSCAEKAEHKLQLRREATDSMNALSFKPRRSLSRRRSFSRNRSRSQSRPRYSNSRPRYSNSRGRSQYKNPPNNNNAYSHTKRDHSNTRDVKNHYQQRDRSQSRNRPRQQSQVNSIDKDDQQFNSDLNC